MFNPKFMTPIPGKSLEGALELANKLLWNLSWKRSESTWFLFAGDVPICESDSEDVIWAVIYGLAMAYGTLPEPFFTDFQEFSNATREGNAVAFLRKKGWRER